MTVSLSTLYSRLGKLMGIAKAQIDARAAIKSRVTTLDGSYDAASRYMFTPVLNYFLNLGKSQDRSITESVSGAVKTLTEMVYTDNPNIAKSAISALRELNRQMIAATATFPANTITQGAVSFGAANVGTGKIILHGIPSQMSPTETLRFECVSDTTTGSTAGREQFTVTGSARVSDITSDEYPAGSGASGSITSSDYNDGQNTVSNGGFDSWTAGNPDSWTGASAGVSQLSSGMLRGSSCLQATNTSQQLVQEGSAQLVGPNKRVIFGFWIKKISGTQTNDIELEFSNTATAAVLASAIASGASLTTSWQLYTASYQFPANAPVAAVSLTLSISANTTAVLAIDGVFCFIPLQYGVNGQFIQIIGGTTDWRIGDYATIAITNDYYATVLNYTERFFAPFQNGIELPTTTGTPTILNSVIP